MRAQEKNRPKAKPKNSVSLVQKWKHFFINPGDDPTRALTRAYILALGLIAFFTVSSHVITAHISEQQKESAAIAYQIGRQRTLTQQILLYASNYYRTNEELDYDFMMQSLWDMKKGHTFLTTTINDRKHRSAALSRIYYKPPFTLDEKVGELAGVVESFAKYPPPGKAGESEESIKLAQDARQDLVDKMAYITTNSLRPAMDAALESYQTESLEKMARFYNVQLGGALFILVVLTAEALLIFRPLIAKIKGYHETLQRYALEDSLTGLKNRRAFMNAAVTEMRRAKRDGTPVTVALLDLDFFKKINDTYGHEVGDKVLQHFSGVLEKTLRAGDFTGRIGGEEFAVLLPKIDRTGAVNILQRLCDTVASTPCVYKTQGGGTAELNYTVSIGFTGPTLIDEQTIDDLTSKADEALYKSKENGRNCISSVD